MAAPLRHHDRLDALFADVARLRLELVEREREAGELLDGERSAADANALALATRIMLDAAKDRYIAESEAVRASMCPIHGDGRQVSCPDCVARSPQLKPQHDAYLKAVAEDEAEELMEGLTGTIAAVDEGRALAIEPRHTLRILEASRRKSA